MSIHKPLLNIKSIYIINKILSNLLQFRMFKLIRYNKNIQKKLGINYIKKYKMIEIEIIPDTFGQFINIDEENDKYCHIYFNGNDEEKKSKKLTSEDKVTKIKIILDYEIKSFAKLFSNCCCKKIIFNNFIRNDINNMRYMFTNCQMLKYINLSNFRTENVLDMSGMFSGCHSLEEINLSSFNACNTTKISFMFSGCQLLKSIDLSKFNAKKITEMFGTFDKCYSLKFIDITGLNTQN